MNKRFISLAAALLLGYVSAQADPAAEQAHQNDFEADSKDLVKEWDANRSAKLIGCNLYDDFTFFNIQGISGPYSKLVNLRKYETAADGTQTTSYESKKFEVRFCNPAYETKESDKSSLAYMLNDAGDRDVRLTSGSSTMKYTETIREIDSETGDNVVKGIKFYAH